MSLGKLFLHLLFLGFFVTGTAYAEISRFIRVDQGVYRGSQPEDGDDYVRLKKTGVRTIINLRDEKSAKKERKVAYALGMKFFNIPLSGFYAPSDEDVEKILSLMAKPELQPVFIHCRYGKDRTGLLVGLYRIRYQGWQPELAYKEALELDFNRKLFGLNYYFRKQIKKHLRGEDDEGSLQEGSDFLAPINMSEET
ncbi:MAG: tyrosine-protein phosphatase [Bdellovibrionota bacterium]